MTAADIIRRVAGAVRAASTQAAATGAVPTPDEPLALVCRHFDIAVCRACGGVTLGPEMVGTAWTFCPCPVPPKSGPPLAVPIHAC